jgi:hypothetical protein
VGQLLKKLDDLGIANETIVIYTTDNGAETFTWPDGGTTPFRGEKNTKWFPRRRSSGDTSRLSASFRRGRSREVSRSAMRCKC